MIANDTDCLDVLKQTYAVRRGVTSLEALILEAQLRALVSTEPATGYDETLGELLFVYDLAGRHFRR